MTLQNYVNTEFDKTQMLITLLLAYNRYDMCTTGHIA